MPEPAHVVLGGLRALLGLLQLLLRLPELGKVQRGDLLRVLDLLLVPAKGIGSCFTVVLFFGRRLRMVLR